MDRGRGRPQVGGIRDSAYFLPDSRVDFGSSSGEHDARFHEPWEDDVDSGTDADVIVAYCGLVCTNCGMYRKGKCLGCHSDRPMNRNCKMKACAMERGYVTCADCTDFDDLARCRKLNNLVSRFFGLVFRTDRIGNLGRIRQVGMEVFKQEKMKQGRP